jgi:gamma-polyglutamate synthase
VPRRIAVTGTRGKSGVTRLVAAGLRASGTRVLAKTTGSKPVVILPDGSEREIVRPGPASIREQVRLVELAASLGAEALVTEMMSIGEETLAVESRRILRPSALLVTNVRLDHLDEMGRDRDAIARTMAAAVPDGAEVFMPAEEAHAAFEKASARRGSTLYRVAPGPGKAGSVGAAALTPGEFEPNRRLARAVLGSLGLDERTTERGFREAVPDAGSLRIVTGTFGDPPRPATCVSLFAANDPASSRAALRQVLDALGRGGRPLVALLALREDRGDRTLQWIRAAEEGFFGDFASVFLAGPPARAALRKLGRAAADPAGPRFGLADERTPGALMSRVVSSAEGKPLVVGLGNFVGLGEALVDHWLEKGIPHGV